MTLAAARTAGVAALAVLAAVPAAASAGGAAVVASQRIDRRQLDLTVRTPALAAPTEVRVLLPDGYERKPRRRYPVLYLLHGASDDYRGWTRSGDVQRTTAGTPLIVVMPDGGRGGWYANWYNHGAGGPPRWETYHVDQLVRLVDHRFRTVPTRSGRAIAGLSMGGFGALSYAARHPGTFASAASFSGGVDLNFELGGIAAGQLAVDATSAQDGGRPGSVFGDFKTQNVRWRGHNPLDLAANLRGLGVTLRTGNGQAGGPFGGAAPDVIEIGAHGMNVRVHQRLARLGVPHVWDDYGPGTHTWPYWARDLRQTLPSLMRRFAHPVAPPHRVTYTSIERAYGVYGWRVRLRRRDVAFSTLLHASRHGFALRGDGVATVTTPRRYEPGARLRVSVGGASRTVRVRRSGSLRVALGALRGRTVRVRIA